MTRAKIIQYPASTDPHAPTLDHVMRCAECQANARGVAAQDRQATYPELQRQNIPNLDEALYAASCFAANAQDGSQTVTILSTVTHRKESYRIEDGEVGNFRDNDAGQDWEAVYVIKAPRAR
jgi:hypothetical protein